MRERVWDQRESIREGSVSSRWIPTKWEPRRSLADGKGSRRRRRTETQSWKLRTWDYFVNCQKFRIGSKGQRSKRGITWSFDLRLAHCQRLCIRDNEGNIIGSSSELKLHRSG
ncbi:hypothetical protein LINGRAHAP2_LOCUS31953 [Linum grandiflorum]